MSSRKRILSQSNIYHIISRGNNKNFIFRTNKDKKIYLNLVRRMELESQIEVIAWCIMNNHVHLLIRADLADLGKALLKINSNYARYYHHSNETCGHLFEDRFYSEPIETEAYLRNCIRYIHSNPINAEIIDDISKYRWSSYKEYIAPQKTPLISEFIRYFGSTCEDFIAFHQLPNNSVFLDIEEDIHSIRSKVVERSIQSALNSLGYMTSEELIKDRENLKLLCTRLLRQPRITLCSIAKTLDISDSSLRRYIA